jgi:hypothetical protein
MTGDDGKKDASRTGVACAENEPAINQIAGCPYHIHSSLCPKLLRQILPAIAGGALNL